MVFFFFFLLNIFHPLQRLFSPPKLFYSWSKNGKKGWGSLMQVENKDHVKTKIKLVAE